jgi:hypothetical protein
MESQGASAAAAGSRNVVARIVYRSGILLRGDAVATTLLELMEELLQSIEQREAGDPDAPAWEASARIERLEAELVRRLESGGEPDVDAAADPQVRRRREVLAGV